jgi:hypothetical protein
MRENPGCPSPRKIASPQPNRNRLGRAGYAAKEPHHKRPRWQASHRAGVGNAHASRRLRAAAREAGQAGHALPATHL